MLRSYLERSRIFLRRFLSLCLFILARRLFNVLVMFQMPRSSIEGIEKVLKAAGNWSESIGRENDSHSEGLNEAEGASKAKEEKDRRTRSELLWKRNDMGNSFETSQLSRLPFFDFERFYPSVIECLSSIQVSNAEFLSSDNFLIHFGWSNLYKNVQRQIRRWDSDLHVSLRAVASQVSRLGYNVLATWYNCTRVQVRGSWWLWVPGTSST